MYKTVRHGENSLQYTILPQTEEVLSNSGFKGKGRDYSPSIHVRRSRRKSTVKYVLLILFGVIVALALASVPLYIMSGALLARRNQQNNNEVITTAPLVLAVRDMAKSRKKELKMSPEVILTISQKTETSTTVKMASTITSTVPPTITNERTTSPPWTMPALRSWKRSTSSTIPPLPTEDNELSLIASSNKNRVLNLEPSATSWEKDKLIRATATPESITLLNVIRHNSRSHVPSEKSLTSNTKIINDDLIITKPTTTKSPVTVDFSTTSERNKFKDLKDAMLEVDDDDELKDALEVDEVFSLPPLKPDYAAPGTDSDEVTVSKAGDSGWYGARWPFVDTSSYFQWTGYSPGDNLLLPLLVSALSSIALVLLLALAVRRRKRTIIISSQIGLPTDRQADDNTNLLTAENAEEGEE